jgi:hypothetical protein
VAEADERDSGLSPPERAEHQLLARRTGWRLLRRLVIYHVVVAVVVLLISSLFPSFLDELPIGGVSELEVSGELTVGRPEGFAEDDNLEIVSSLMRATSELDSLGYARKLLITLLGTWLLMLPVAWVHKGIHERSAHDHSLDETTLILPGVVAAIVLVVQHSLALAFSLAGIVAGVQFRRALQDTFDALFILVAIGVGIAAGVEALEIAAVLTVFFCYSTLYVCFWGDGLESHYIRMRKIRKEHKRSEAADRSPPPHSEPDDRPD